MTVNRYHTAVFIVITITLLSTGAAAMIYEVVLLREFTLLLGSSFYSGSIVLASIMGGLAIVNILNGKQLSKWGGMSPVSMENIALFVPA
jgi:hypothetical protein